MANVIKHKRGSGSDPVASDLVVGEVAIRTDVGKLFTKMDNGSVAEIAGGGSDIAINTLSSSSATGGGSATFNGSAYRFTLSAPPSVSAQQLLVSINGVIQKPVAGTGQPSEGFSVDGTDIILGDAPAAGSDFFILTFKSLGVSEPADNSVTSAKIADGAIVNADINASAAIAGSKITSSFGSQHVNIDSGYSYQWGDSHERIEQSDTKIEFFTNNTEKMTLSGSNLGIGTTSPATILHVKANVGDMLRLDRDNSGAVGNQIAFRHKDGSGNFVETCSINAVASSNAADGNLRFHTKTSGGSNTEKLRITEAGRVGIGTTSPGANLEVLKGSVGTYLKVGGDNASNGRALTFTSSTGNTGSNGALHTINATSSNGAIALATGSSEALRIDSSGLVNIGSGANASGLSPLLHLHKAASNATAYLHITNADTGITNNDGFVIGFNSSLDALIFNKESTPLRFATAGTERMRIDAGGGLQLGTTTATASKFTIYGSDAASIFQGSNTGTGAGNGFITGNNGDVNAFVWNYENGFMQFATNNTERMRITSSGDLGIGTTSPDRTIHCHNSSSTTNVRAKFSNGTTGEGASDGFEIGINGSDPAQAVLVNNENSPMAFFTNASERMRIDNSGNIAIGNTSPQQLLHVWPDTANTSSAYVRVTAGDRGSGTGVQLGHNSSGNAELNVVSNGHLTLFTNNSERLTILNTGKVGIGTTNPSANLHSYHATDNEAARFESGDEYVHVVFKDSTTTNEPYIGAQGNNLRAITGGAERMRIDSSGNVLVGTTSATVESLTSAGQGVKLAQSGRMLEVASNAQPAVGFNRTGDDGTIVRLIGQGSLEGTIQVSGSTVSYNGGHLSRWSQFKGLSTTDKSARPTIYQGTVMSNLDDLCVWEGEDNQQLNMTKVSDVVGDKDVAGVFFTWDDDDDKVVNDFYVAMTGDMVIRVADSTTVARGDLLISAGDGTAKPQADDIIRSSTIAKIISINHTATYPDGSKAYPCVLMAC